MTIKHLYCAVLMALAATRALAAVGNDEARQLGTTLTEFGAIKAGNKEGTIPAYTGGLTKAPPGFRRDSGFWVDPYRDEKPLYRINAGNMEQYADKLSAGQKKLLRQNPDYYLDIYPTHRSAALPDHVLKATVRNATTCKTLKDNYAVDTACRGGLPFPIPTNGYEVMWNVLLRYVGDNGFTTANGRSWIVDASGRPTMTSDQYTQVEKPYYQTGLADRDPQLYWRAFALTNAPARKSGQAELIADYLDTVDKPRRAWSYSPGQRRVKLAPEFVYDTPVSALGGVILYDELFMFSGKMDRFDFKLLGKKEMFIPYNSYKFNFECKDEAQFTPKHVNPGCERWELHRVWVVEATLKPGFRHAYSKRTYYVDEDTYGAGGFDSLDHNGELYRSMFNSVFQAYDHAIPLALKSVTYDFNRSNYAVLGDASVGGFLIPGSALPEREMTVEAMVARETTR
ncbi:DUF1329 domain-containing protein [Massilia sp. TW-1]|uniref:DUF1329 domain-containing protein n=1 Tax=Telluria antibiotica TaxID=2717319 RepID=A0ABX0P765_9BURK|nr:DUF1329 domain-containing protein [Telluria antibiotica]NIA52453.1 DUF1329 domain-containing protein [Telluria antibiotica]